MNGKGNARCDPTMRINEAIYVHYGSEKYALLKFLLLFILNCEL